MSNSQLPYSTPQRAAKRKRAGLEASRGFEGSPPLSIPMFVSQTDNPGGYLSQPGDLEEPEDDPTLTVPNFPHRGFTSLITQDQGDHEKTEQGRKLQRVAGDALGQGQPGILIRSMHHFIDKGDITKAARTYGLVLQQRPNGRVMDVRQHNLWAIGAEIIMREGEEQRQWQNAMAGHSKEKLEANAGDRVSMPQRWGAAANVSKVKAYFEELIERYPYSPRSPYNISALDFYLAMFNCEVYNTHTEHIAALFRLKHEQLDSEDDEESLRHSPWTTSGDRSASEWDAKLEKHKDRLRSQAFENVKDISRRMDKLMQKPPYSQNHSILRLRGIVSLYIADLVMPVAETTLSKIREARDQRQKELETASNALQRVLETGGDLDPATYALIQHGDAPENHYARLLYSSLPIRKG